MNLFVGALFAATFLFLFSSALKEGQTCVADKSCDAGLHCDNCVANGGVRLRCTRIQPLKPASMVSGLPFNRYSWLTTHNAFARVGAKSATGSVLITPMNQQDSITSQLNSPAMSVRTRSLVLMNYFPDGPDLTQACKHNSAPLISMINTCHAIDGNRWPNFIAVDFYKRSDGGGAPEEVDMENGQMICGCASVASCKPNMTFGVCELPKASPIPVLTPTPTPTPNGAIPKRTNRGNSTSFATLQSNPFRFQWLSGASLTVVITLFL